MREDRHSGHTITRLTAHLVWVTKYRYAVLQRDIKVRCRDLLIQICDAEDLRILKGVVSKDHVHMHIEYGPSKWKDGLFSCQFIERILQRVGKTF